jgi:hypothetical protein
MKTCNFQTILGYYNNIGDSDKIVEIVDGLLEQLHREIRNAFD